VAVVAMRAAVVAAAECRDIGAVPSAQPFGTELRKMNAQLIAPGADVWPDFNWNKTPIRHYFDANDAAALAKAEERFKQLTGQGFTAAVRTKPGEVTKINSFNPKAEETVFFPRLIGG